MPSRKRNPEGAKKSGSTPAVATEEEGALRNPLIGTEYEKATQKSLFLLKTGAGKWQWVRLDPVIPHWKWNGGSVLLG